MLIQCKVKIECMHAQLSYLNKGAQGFVVLANNPEKKKMYALKFILKSTVCDGCCACVNEAAKDKD